MEKWRYTIVILSSGFPCSFYPSNGFGFGFSVCFFSLSSYRFAVSWALELPNWKAHNPQSYHCFDYYTEAEVLCRICHLRLATISLWFWLLMILQLKRKLKTENRKPNQTNEIKARKRPMHICAPFDKLIHFHVSALSAWIIAYMYTEISLVSNLYILLSLF